MISNVELRKQLKMEMDKHYKEGGNIFDNVEDLPYAVLLYQIIFLERKQGKETDINSIYKDNGYETNQYIKNKVTIERLKIEIEAHLKNGGGIYEPINTLPYYIDMHSYQRRMKSNGKEIGVAEIYKLCGYGNKIGHNYCELDLADVFNTVKNENGSIDKLKGTNKGDKVISAARRKANALNIDFNTYLAVMYGVRFDKDQSIINTIKYIDGELKNYSRKYGKEYLNYRDICELNPKLAYKIKYWQQNFPLGAVTFNEIIDCYGYGINLDSRKINEKLFLKEIKETYPDNDVTGIFDDHRYRLALLKVSRQNKKNVFEYLEKNNFTWKEKKSKAISLNNDKVFKYVCELRKKLLEKSVILNSDNYSKEEKNKEFEKIGNSIYKKLIEIEIKVLNKKQ